MKENPVLTNVSRETIERLRKYEALALKWTKKINLVSRGDALFIWERHILDSIKVHSIAPENGHWLDLGSGGGFPGLVAAILEKERNPERQFTLVDSDQRKCVFLRTVARELELNVSVISERLEHLKSMDAAVVSARALDDLTKLLGYAFIHLSPQGVGLFPKGANWKSEEDAARNHWSYRLEVFRSETNPDSTILKIEELERV